MPPAAETAAISSGFEQGNIAPQISGTRAPVWRQNAFDSGSKLTPRRCSRVNGRPRLALEARLRALERRALGDPRRVGLEARARLEALGHQPEADLRADVDVHGAERVAENVRPRCDRLLGDT